jgi:hypothetical protein
MPTPRKRSPGVSRSFSPSAKSEEQTTEGTEVDLFVDLPTAVEVEQEITLLETIVKEKEEVLLPPITPLPDPGPRFIPKEELPVPIKQELKAPGKSLLPTGQRKHPRNVPKISRHNAS